RLTVLGYIQRGGAPSARDRASAALMGVRAVDCLKRGDGNYAVIFTGGNVGDIDLLEANAMMRGMDENMYRSCTRIDNSYYWD
ncbi:MAG: 6-phosphofructokinase, partial [Oscillospiraceae bacterium]|nr:6-phosphofructokinase [Oscillospiraceae bacterium]